MGIDKLAVACSCTGMAHCAIYFEFKESAEKGKDNFKTGDVIKLHFTTAVKARPLREPEDYLWVCPCDLLPEQITQLLSFFHDLTAARKAARIPYGIRQSLESKLDPKTGAFLPGPGSTGLSCTGFVLLIFKECGAPLTLFGEWQPRTDDLAVQDKQIEFASEHDEEAKTRLTKERGSPRCRPEEVVGACTIPNRPAKFVECETVGKAIVEFAQQISAKRALATPPAPPAEGCGPCELPTT